MRSKKFSGRLAAALTAALLALFSGTARAQTGRTNGAALFAAECAGCHGLKGDGKGVADPAMQPQPRDLTSGKFKLRSTWSRSPITDDELFGTITNGIPGTAMPAFRFLSDDERRQLAAYVASLAGLPESRTADVVNIPPQPADTPDLIAQGKQLYADLGCPACHGPEGKGDGAAGPYLKDEWGNKTPPRDFHADPFKGGDSARDLYLRFAIGMPGTPMPAYAEAVSPEKLWALVAFVRSLRPTPSKSHPSDTVAWGKELVAQKHCLACHSLPAKSDVSAANVAKNGQHTPSANAGERVGGEVGPPLDFEVDLLNPVWAKQFLIHPRDAGKLYPTIPYRMPDLGLNVADADAIWAYLAAYIGSADAHAMPTPSLARADLQRGREIYTTSCAACHQLDGRAPSAPVAKQGPDLTASAQRFNLDFVLRFVAEPGRYDPKTSMSTPNLSAAELRDIAAYVWSGGS